MDNDNDSNKTAEIVQPALAEVRDTLTQIEDMLREKSVDPELIMHAITKSRDQLAQLAVALHKAEYESLRRARQHNEPRNIE